MTFPQINTLKDALDAGMITGGRQLTRYFLDINKRYFDAMETEMLSRYQTCDSLIECVERVVDDQNFCALLNIGALNYHKSHFIDLNGDLPYRFLPKIFVSRPTHVTTIKVSYLNVRYCLSRP